MVVEKNKVVEGSGQTPVKMESGQILVRSNIGRNKRSNIGQNRSDPSLVKIRGGEGGAGATGRPADPKVVKR